MVYIQMYGVAYICMYTIRFYFHTPVCVPERIYTSVCIPERISLSHTQVCIDILDVRVYIQIYYIHGYVHILIHSHMYRNWSACTDVRVWVHESIYRYIYMYRYINICIYMYMCGNLCTYVYIDIFICEYVYGCVYIYIHA